MGWSYQYYFFLFGAMAILGYFNVFLHNHERNKSHSHSSIRSMQRFQQMVEMCDLINGGFQGNPFSWRRNNLAKRLDKLLVNMQWFLKFHEAYVFHLPFFKSDHRPILVQLSKDKGPNRNHRSINCHIYNITNNMDQVWMCSVKITCNVIKHV